MSPNLMLRMELATIFMWNGEMISLPASYSLVPDHEIRHLHQRVVAMALHERKRIPFYGRLVGKARHGNGKGSVWLVANDHGQIIKSQKPMPIGGSPCKD